MRRLALAAALACLALPISSAGAQSQRPVCPGPATHGMTRCFAHVIVDRDGKPVRTSTPSGYGPADLQSAYAITPSAANPTVAIVDAYDDPTAAQDLAKYRSQFGLPACGTGCFTKVNQSGGSVLPAANAGWAQEISLDLDMVSAICPNCRILLVEGSSANLTDLGAAASWAASNANVVAVSNSYGTNEFSGLSSYAGYYAPPSGKVMTVSSGDSGYGVQFPADLSTVIAVGGTSLTRSKAGVWSESAWSGAGSGCSKYVAPVSWQPAVAGCGGRIVADVSAVADPNTGVAVYDSTSYQGRSGWMKFGGTSAAAPIIASVYAQAASVQGPQALYSAIGGSDLRDPRSGSNGSCGGSLLCTAGAGFDGPTGVGTPQGTGAF